MTYGPVSQCATCARMLGASPVVLTAHCAAFPAGIPELIYGNRLGHREPIDGDGGFQWVSNGGRAHPAEDMVRSP